LNRSFPIDSPAFGHAVTAVSVDQVVACDMTQPKVKRHIGLTEIIAESTAGFEKHFLGDVAGIHPTSNGPVQTHIDHSPDRLSMPGQQLIDCRRLALFGFG
jgi:hypothetical protein